MPKINVDSSVFEYKVLGKAIKNSDVIEIYSGGINPRENEAQLFLLGAGIDIEQQKYGWYAFVSHAILKRFQQEFQTIRI